MIPNGPWRYGLSHDGAGPHRAQSLFWTVRGGVFMIAKTFTPEKGAKLFAIM